MCVKDKNYLCSDGFEAEPKKGVMFTYWSMLNRNMTTKPLTRTGRESFFYVLSMNIRSQCLGDRHLIF